MAKRSEMPEIVEYAVRQSGFDPNDVADWRVETDLTGPDPPIDVLLRPELPEQIEITVVKSED